MSPARPIRAHELAKQQIQRISDSAGGAVTLLGSTPPTAERPYLRLAISLDCSSTPSDSNGVRLRDRERFDLLVGPDYPERPPSVRVSHTRFRSLPHVQWQHLLCLYRAPAIEWLPQDGMNGLLERLKIWLQAAAAGSLDPAEGPLHPPVAYYTADAGTMIVEANSPTHESEWLGLAVLEPAPATGIYRLTSWLPHGADVGDMAGLSLSLGRDAHPDTALAAAAISNHPLGFEYPESGLQLVSLLEQGGLPLKDLIAAVASAATFNHLAKEVDARERPMHLVLGAPGRRAALTGKPLTHVTAWRFNDLGQRIAALGRVVTDARPSFESLRDEVADLLSRWLSSASVSWMQIIEDRPEVTLRRDDTSAMSWVRSKRVAVIGCGALGGPLAEHCVRAGAAAITLVDSGQVTPGLLVRQPYEQAQIAEAKPHALRDRLLRIHPDLALELHEGDALRWLDSLGSAPGYDLIIDASANGAVRSRIEAERARSREAWPPLLTVLVSQRCQRGLAILSPAGSPGGSRDALRKLAGSAEPGWSRTLIDFFPPVTQLGFEPEPGCSEPTFVGSNAEVAFFAASSLLTTASLLGNGEQRTSCTAMPSPLLDEEGRLRLFLPNDLVLTDVGGLEIRIEPAALQGMRAECRRGTRLRGVAVETGGTLLGEVDEAAGVIWVSKAGGPPPDSRLSRTGFHYGIQGVAPYLEQERLASRGTRQFLGVWHTHPSGEARPSPQDHTGMECLLVPGGHSPRRALMLILGGTDSVWSDWLEHGRTPAIFAAFVDQVAETHANAKPAANMLGDLGREWWTGGYRSTLVREPRSNPRYGTS